MVTDPHDEAPWRSWDREEWWEYEPDCGMPEPDGIVVRAVKDGLMAKWLANVVQRKMEMKYLSRMFGEAEGIMEAQISVGTSSLRLSLADNTIKRVLEAEVIRYGEIWKCIQSYGLEPEFERLESDAEKEQTAAKIYSNLAFDDYHIVRKRSGRVISVIIDTPDGPIIDDPDILLYETPSAPQDDPWEGDFLW